MDEAGDVTAVWAAVEGTSSGLFARRHGPDGWEPTVAIDHGEGDIDGVKNCRDATPTVTEDCPFDGAIPIRELFVDAAGNVTVLFTQEDLLDGPIGLYANRWEPGSGWLGAERLGTPPQSQSTYSPQVIRADTDEQGGAHVAWLVYDEAATPTIADASVYHLHAADYEAGAWRSELLATIERTGQWYGLPLWQHAINGNGDHLVTWQASGTASNIVARVRRSGGSWQGALTAISHSGPENGGVPHEVEALPSGAFVLVASVRPLLNLDSVAMWGAVHGESSWSSQELLTVAADSPVETGFDLVAAGQEAHALWWSRGGAGALSAARYSPTTGWSTIHDVDGSCGAPTSIPNPTTYWHDTWAFGDAEGYATYFFSAASASSGTCFVQRSSAGVWSSPVPASVGGTRWIGTGSGTGNLSWSAGGSVLSQHFDPSTGWGAMETLVAPAGLTVTGEGQLASGPGGHALALFGADGVVWASSFAPASGWSPLGGLRWQTEAGQYVAGGPVVVDSSGVATVFYAREEYDYVTYPNASEAPFWAIDAQRGSGEPQLGVVPGGAPGGVPLGVWERHEGTDGGLTQRIEFEGEPDAGTGTQRSWSITTPRADGVYSEFEWSTSGTQMSVTYTLVMFCNLATGQWQEDAVPPGTIDWAYEATSMKIDLDGIVYDSATSGGGNSRPAAGSPCMTGGL